MKIKIYKEDIELLETALRHELEHLQFIDDDHELDYEIMNAEDLLDKFLFIKRVYGYKDIVYMF